MVSCARGTVAVSCVADTNVVANGAPSSWTTAPERTALPATVTTVLALPMNTALGLTLARTGTTEVHVTPSPA